MDYNKFEESQKISSLRLVLVHQRKKYLFARQIKQLRQRWCNFTYGLFVEKRKDEHWYTQLYKKTNR